MHYEWIKLYEDADHELVLNIADASPSDPYILKAVDGLGSEFDLSMAGKNFTGRRAQTREISFLIALNPDYAGGQTLDELKEGLYGFIESSHPDFDQSCVILFGTGDSSESWTGKVWPYVTGKVKSLTPAKFTKDFVVQIVFVCSTPYFRSFTNNPMPSEQRALLDPLNFEVVSEGNAPAEFSFSVQFTAAKSEYWIAHDSGKRIKVEYDFGIGDKLTIATSEDTQKIISVDPAGINPSTSIIWALTEDSEWFAVHPGVNTFTTSTDDVEIENVNAFRRWWVL